MDADAAVAAINSVPAETSPLMLSRPAPFAASPKPRSRSPVLLRRGPGAGSSPTAGWVSPLPVGATPPRAADQSPLHERLGPRAAAALGSVLNAGPETALPAADRHGAGAVLGPRSSRVLTEALGPDEARALGAGDTLAPLNDTGAEDGAPAERPRIVDAMARLGPRAAAVLAGLPPSPPPSPPPIELTPEEAEAAAAAAAAAYAAREAALLARIQAVEEAQARAEAAEAAVARGEQPSVPAARAPQPEPAAAAAAEGLLGADSDDESHRAFSVSGRRGTAPAGDGNGAAAR